MPSRLLEVWDLARALDLAPNQYMAKYEPEFGPIAYEDIIDLTEHVRRAFPEVTSKTPAYELGFPLRTITSIKGADLFSLL